MTKLFICSTGYMARCFIKMLDYILNFDVDEVILSRENHCRDTLFDITNIPIIAFSDLRQCVDYSTITIILNNESLPEKSIVEIQRLCEEQGKRCVNIVLHHQSSVLGAYNEVANFPLQNDRPIILLSSIGAATEHSYTEILLNSVFSKNDVNFYQKFSQSTYELLSALSEHNLLRKSLTRYLLGFDSPKDLYIITISVDEMKDLALYKDFLQHNCPDYVFLQLSLGYLSNDEALSSIKKVALVDADLIIRSRYRFACGEFSVYCNKPTYQLEGELDSDSNNFKEILERKVISALSFPLGMSKL